ncbi:hypothetical protein [Lysobacter capsici]|uniref:hypothetical protein n=1 Tax=Lysobacter capsici TaxID=435897 RepID=UPI00287BA65E|nr:hypothetical protein [Lysobacter capsici]WND79380.1 hypothetical protein RJ610_19065 [Lysobacter capsici]WND84576.1 hypothetical protein RJ609_19080 [Lysobacter capsici]
MHEPEETRTDLFVRAAENGQVEYGVMRDGHVVATTTIPGKNVAFVVGKLLAAAHEAQENTGLPEPVNEHEVNTSIVMPSTYGLAVHPHAPQRISLEFGFRGAVVAMSLDASSARNLGQQLVTMTADGPKQ